MAATSSTEKASPAGTLPGQNPDGGWQQKCKSFAEMGKFLLEKQHLCDVVLRCGVTETGDLKAQKSILAASSPLFEEMFFGTQRSTDPVPIIRVEAEKPVVEVLLKLMYGYDHAGLLTMANAFPVLQASDKYKVQTVMDRCETWIKENLNATNCLSLLMTAEESQATSFHVSVQEDCWKYIDQSAAEVLRCPQFVEIDRSLLSNILKRNSLRVGELAVYEAAMKWASSTCKRENRTDDGNTKRIVLADAVYQIRFTLMSAEEFLNGPAKSQLLSSEEVSSIMLHIITDKKPTLQFITEPRVINVPSGSFKVERFAATAGKRLYFYDHADDIDSVRFSVDRKITLLGCEIYTSGKDQYIVDVKVFTGANKNPIHEERITVPPLCHKFVTGPACVAQVNFSKELPIRCSTQCVIQCDIEGKESDYGIKGMRTTTVRVPLDKGNFIRYCFRFWHDSASDTSIRSSISNGQIPNILFRP